MFGDCSETTSARVHQQEALNSLQHLHAERQGQWFKPIAGWKARFQAAGHILGAASLLLEVAVRRIFFRVIWVAPTTR